jgi:hypothetical protein
MVLEDRSRIVSNSDHEVRGLLTQLGAEQG